MGCTGSGWLQTRILQIVLICFCVTYFSHLFKFTLRKCVLRLNRVSALHCEPNAILVVCKYCIANYFCPPGQYFQSSQSQIPAPVCLLTLCVLTARHCAIPATRPAPSETAATATINATAAAADIRAKDIFWMEIWPGESTLTVMSFCCQQTIDDRTAACLS